jgi:hypothetical protein
VEGKILDYNSQSRQGLIRGNDGNRYEFSADEYRSQAEIRIGQAVDFEVDGKRAVGVYLLMNKLTQTAGSLVGQENVEKVTQALQGGVQNLPGVVVSGVTILTLFFPVVETNLSLIGGGIGVLSLLLLLGLGYLFYTGAKRRYTKILAGITGGLLIVGLYGLLAPLRKAEQYLGIARGLGVSVPSLSFFDFVQFGFYAVVVATIALLFLAFVGSYKSR